MVTDPLLLCSMVTTHPPDLMALDFVLPHMVTDAALTRHAAVVAAVRGRGGA
jgi:hypothetical protein